MLDSEFKNICNYLKKTSEKPSYPKYLVTDRDDFIYLINNAHTGKVMYVAPASFYNDRELTELLIKSVRGALKYVNPIFYDDKELMLDSICAYFGNTQYLNSLLYDKEFAKTVIKRCPAAYNDFPSNIKSDPENVLNAMGEVFNVGYGYITIKDLTTVEQARVYIRIKPSDYSKLPNEFKFDKGVLKSASLDKINKDIVEKQGIDIKKSYLEFLEDDSFSFENYKELVKFNDDEYLYNVIKLLCREHHKNNVWYFERFIYEDYETTSIELIKLICSNCPEYYFRHLSVDILKNEDIMLNVVKPSLLKYNNDVRKITDKPIFKLVDYDYNPKFLLDFFTIRGFVCTPWIESYVSEKFIKQKEVNKFCNNKWKDYLNYLISNQSNKPSSKSKKVVANIKFVPHELTTDEISHINNQEFDFYEYLTYLKKQYKGITSIEDISSVDKDKIARLTSIHDCDFEEFLNRFNILNRSPLVEDNDGIKEYQNDFSNVSKNLYDAKFTIVILLSPLGNKILFTMWHANYNDETSLSCDGYIAKGLKKISRKLYYRKIYEDLLRTKRAGKVLDTSTVILENVIEKIYGKEYLSSIYGVHISSSGVFMEDFQDEANYKSFHNEQLFTLGSRLFLENNLDGKYEHFYTTKHNLIFIEKQFDFDCEGLFFAVAPIIDYKDLNYSTLYDQFEEFNNLDKWYYKPLVNSQKEDTNTKNNKKEVKADKEKKVVNDDGILKDVIF